MAALSVVCLHAMTYGYPPKDVLWLQKLYAYSQYGSHGVTLFFLISGFCIHLRWARQQATTGHSQLDFLTFWKRRLHRLYPPYFVALCISMGLVLIAYLMGRETAVVASYPGSKPHWLMLDFSSHVFMLHGFHPVLDWGGGNPPFWTLAREEHFYLLYFPLLLWRQRIGLAGAFISVAVLGYIFPQALSFMFPVREPYLYFLGSTVILSSAIVLWYQWCLGMVAVEAYYKLCQLPRLFYSIWLAPLCIAIALGQGHLYDLVWLSNLLWVTALFILINYCVKMESEGHWPDHFLLNWFTRVGLFSYSLYLIHMPTLSIVQRLLPTKATTNPWMYLGNALIITVACYYAGWTFFLLVERHFLHTRPTHQPEGVPRAGLGPHRQP